ncbi:MAG TPA: copper transporter, partial [Coriobacteriia bacterium]
LSVGLLLGTIVVERGVLNTQRTALVEGIQKDLNKVRTSNQDLKTANDALVSFASASSGVLVRGALTGRVVVIVADPDSAETVARASETVRQAGGTPVVATFTSPGLSLGEAAVVAAVSGPLGSPPGDQLRSRVADALAREWTTPNDPRTVTSALTSAGGLKLQGLEPGAIVAGTVVSAVYASVPDTGALTLARSLATPARPAVGVETAARATGQANAAVAEGLSAVDDIDSPMGQVSLVWVLATRATGHFGLGEGADAAFPQPLLSQ